MSASTCPSCGAAVDQDRVEGLCPACLLEAVMAEAEEGSPLDDATGADDTAPGDPPPRVGPYTPVRVLGEGGMGVVYLARQDSPIARDVALKVVRPGLDSRQILARFASERQALALMDHPGIAKVFDAGALPDGRPYFVMEYVPGQPITQFCDEQRLGIRDRLQLFRDACLAVHHAHTRGIIHRDIKPSNVLVFHRDGERIVKIIDFGIAKATSPQPELGTLFTEHGMLLGTPEYMSPERATMAGQYGPACDVYSLGALLYELLTGSLPIDLEHHRAHGYLEVARIIQDEEPVAPSERVSRSAGSDVAHRRGLESRALSRRLQGELDWIVLRALDKEPARRYPSAAELAEDVRRYLAGDPVLVGPPTLLYRTGKFVKKNRVLVAAAAAVLLSIVGGLGVSTRLYFREQAEREQAQALGYAAALANASRLVEDGDYARARQQLFTCVPRLRGWEWQLLYALTDTSVATLHAGGDPVLPFPPFAHLVFSDGGARLSFTMLRTVHAWRVGSWKPAGTAGIFGRVLALSPDAATIVARDPTRADTVLVLQAESGRTVARLEGHSDVTAAAIDPTGTLVATAANDGSLQFWEARSGVPRRGLTTPRAGRPRLVFSPDGHRLAWSTGPTVQLVDAAALRIVGHARADDEILALAFRPHLAELLIADGRGRIQIWRTDGETPNRTWTEADAVYAAAFDREGRRVATGSRSGVVRVWDAESGSELAVLSGCDAHEIAAIAFSPDGQLVAVGSRRGTVRAWNLPSHGGGSVLLRDVRTMQASGDRRRLAVSTDSETIVLDSTSGRRVAVLPLAGAAIAADAYGARVALGDAAGMIRIADVASGATTAAWQAHEDEVLSMAFAADGRHLASSGTDRRVKLWDLPSRALTVSIDLPEESAVVALRPDGQVMAAGSGAFQRSVEGGAVTLWQTAAGHPVMTLAPEWDWGEIVRTLAFSPTGHRLAVGEFASGAVRLFDGNSGRLLVSLEGHNGEVTAVAFNPDGRLLASASRDNTIRLWDVERQVPTFVLSRPKSAATAVAFGADGQLYATYADGTLRRWSTHTAYPPALVERLAVLRSTTRLWADVRERVRTDRDLAERDRRGLQALAEGWPDWSAEGSTAVAALLAGPVPAPQAATLLRQMEDLRRTAPWSLDAVSYVGAALFRAGRVDEAIALLEGARVHSPEGPSDELFLAMAYAKVGRVDAARSALERARRMFAGLLPVDQRQMSALLREAQGLVLTVPAAPTPSVRRTSR